MIVDHRGGTVSIPGVDLSGLLPDRHHLDADTATVDTSASRSGSGAMLAASSSTSNRGGFNGPRAADRGAFTHWSDLDRDGCKTRAEVLIAERRAGRVQGCQVIGGRWYSTYDGETVTDAGALHVDHVVALGEAWDSGAQEWDAERRERYASDVGYRNALIAVTARSNSQKSDRDPDDWVPTRRAAWCRYATAWRR